MNKLTIAGVVLSLATVASAQMTLQTTFASNNGSSGNYFDLEATGGSDVDILGFDVNTGSTGSVTVDVWTRPGSYVGTTASSAGWTLVDSFTVTGAGTNNPTALPDFTTPVTIPDGSVQGFAVFVTGGIRYTNGGTLGAVYVSDSYLTFYEGQGTGSTTFGGGLFTVRIWNGNIRYALAGGPAAPAASVFSLVALILAASAAMAVRLRA